LANARPGIGGSKVREGGGGGGSQENLPKLEIHGAAKKFKYIETATLRGKKRLLTHTEQPYNAREERKEGEMGESTHHAIVCKGNICRANGRGYGLKKKVGAKSYWPKWRCRVGLVSQGVQKGGEEGGDQQMASEGARMESPRKTFCREEERLSLNGGKKCTFKREWQCISRQKRKKGKMDPSGKQKHPKREKKLELWGKGKGLK